MDYSNGVIQKKRIHNFRKKNNSYSYSCVYGGQNLEAYNDSEWHFLEGSKLTILGRSNNLDDN